MSRSFKVFMFLMVAMLVIDQLVKFWARSAMTVSQSLGAPWPGVFEISLTLNQGVAFGMLQGKGVYMSPIAVIMAVVAGIYSFRNPKESMWVHISLSLIASGALGNLIDRVFLGKVTDMFWFRLINFPVFNIADSCISVGATILVVRWLWEATFAKKTTLEPEIPTPEG